MAPPPEADLGLDHQALNALAAGYLGRSAAFETLARLGEVTGSRKSLEDAAEKARRLEKWRARLLAERRPVLTDPSAPERATALEWAAQLRSELELYAMRLEAELARLATEPEPDEAAQIAAALVRHHAAADACVRGLLEWISSEHLQDQRPVFEVAVERQAAELAATGDRLARLEAAGTVDEELAEELVRAGARLPGLFRAQANDLHAFAVQLEGGRFSYSHLDIEAGEAQEWDELGIDAWQTGAWRSFGLRPRQAARWLKAGLGDPQLAGWWNALGFGCAEAARWFEHDFGPADAARWRARGVIDPAVAAEERGDDDPAASLRGGSSGEATTVAGSEEDTADRDELSRERRAFAALEEGDTSGFQHLLGEGLDPLACDDGGRSLVHAAAEFDRLCALRSLISLGAPVSTARTIDGETPLMAAARRGHLACVDVLLQAGADPWARDRAGHSAEEHADMRTGDGQEIARRLHAARGRAA